MLENGWGEVPGVIGTDVNHPGVKPAWGALPAGCGSRQCSLRRAGITPQSENNSLVSSVRCSSAHLDTLEICQWPCTHLVHPRHHPRPASGLTCPLPCAVCVGAPSAAHAYHPAGGHHQDQRKSQSQRRGRCAAARVCQVFTLAHASQEGNVLAHRGPLVPRPLPGASLRPHQPCPSWVLAWRPAGCRPGCCLLFCAKHVCAAGPAAARLQPPPSKGIILVAVDACQVSAMQHTDAEALTDTERSLSARAAPPAARYQQQQQQYCMRHSSTEPAAASPALTGGATLPPWLLLGLQRAVLAGLLPLLQVAEALQLARCSFLKNCLQSRGGGRGSSRSQKHHHGLFSSSNSTAAAAAHPRLPSPHRSPHCSAAACLPIFVTCQLAYTIHCETIAACRDRSLTGTQHAGNSQAATSWRYRLASCSCACRKARRRWRSGGCIAGMTWPRVWLMTTGWSKEAMSCRRGSSTGAGEACQGGRACWGVGALQTAGVIRIIVSSSAGLGVGPLAHPCPAHACSMLASPARRPGW